MPVPSMSGNEANDNELMTLTLTILAICFTLILILVLITTAVAYFVRRCFAKRLDTG